MPQGSEASIDFKPATRAEVESSGYHIILNVGDQYSDLVGGYSLYTLKLPNPVYIVN